MTLIPAISVAKVLAQDEYTDYDSTEIIKEAYDDTDSDEEDTIDYSRYARLDTIDIDYRSIISPDIRRKYTDKDYQYQQAPDSDWTERFKQWLSERLMNLFRISDTNVLNRIVNIIVWTTYLLIFILGIWIIYRLIRSKDGRWIFQSQDEEIRKAEEVLSNEEITEDIHSLIKNAEQNDAYRDAIRYLYIWVIKNLHKGNIINYSKQKTTQEYAYEIKDKSLKKEFVEIAKIYNNVWYGYYELSTEIYYSSKAIFQKIIDRSE